MTPPPDPRVTAQQVENGSASLMDFALAVRDQLSRGAVQTAEEAIYIGCLLRQEGGPYRSGSTYLVQLTPDRIFLHAKAMALSGRLLNPVIYGAILRAVGINPADLANPATAPAAFATAASGNGGSFNVPGIPGASGYATVYIGATLGLPIVLLAGFDLNESHVAQEDIDYGDPSITAGDVVDRDTLKDFVTQAGEFFLEHQTSGDLADSSRARIALRDPNGPWRHGSVYLYVLDLNSSIITFHAAFPDRFELKPLVPTVRDAVTGEFILPQVIEAAKSGPEGGFLRYFFDDPTDATDSADIPKVGYARQFSGEIRVFGRVIPVDFIIGSGFYLSDPAVVAARQNNVIETVLPQVMRTMTASTVDAVSGRIRQAYAGAPPASAFSFGGAATLSDALLANGRALGSGAFDPNRLLAGSSFTMPLNAAGAAGSGSGLVDNLTLWGSGDYRNISDSNRQTMAYDGDLVSANLGVDTRLSANLLAGISVGWARGEVDYTDPELVTGELTSTLTSVNPYLGWQSAGGTNLWATAGYGWGEVELDESSGEQESDLTRQMVAAGGSMSLAASERLIEGGTTSLTLKGEMAFTRADIEGAGTLRSRNLNVSRHRVMFEGTHVRRLASDAILTPSIEVGMRYDGGDGQSGAGLEIGGGLGYAAGRLALEVNARGQLTHSEADDYEEWGLSGSLAYQPRSDGSGLSMTVGSGWGAAQNGIQSMWSRQDAVGLARGGPAVTLGQRFQAELRYGMYAPNGLGLWYPYFATESGNSYRALRLGAQLKSAPGFEAGLEIGRREFIHESADHAIELRGSMLW